MTVPTDVAQSRGYRKNGLGQDNKVVGKNAVRDQMQDQP